MDITCGRYKVIHVISVTYGRTDHSTCSRGDTSTKCSTGRATEIVSARCQGKHTCKITASNSVFGDPCVGTFKYMIVEYKCQSEYHIKKHTSENRMLQDYTVPFRYERKLYNNTKINYRPMYAVDL